MSEMNCKILEMTRQNLTSVAQTGRSAWTRGVAAYSLDLLETLEEAETGGYLPNLPCPSAVLLPLCLGGVKDWRHYAYGGNGLIYNADIARRLCAPWELAKTGNGMKRPNAREEWLDTEARALGQAFRLLCETLEQVSQSMDKWTVTWRAETVRAVGVAADSNWGGWLVAPVPGSGGDMSETLLAWADYGAPSKVRRYSVRYTGDGRAYFVAHKKRHHLDSFLRVDGF